MVVPPPLSLLLVDRHSLFSIGVLVSGISLGARVMVLFRTPWNGYAVKFSPYDAGPNARVAVATAQNFGIIGNGRVHVLRVRFEKREKCCC